MTTLSVGLRRLERLAKILDTADAKHRAAHEPTYRQWKYRHPCGTPACALGHWAAHSPAGWTFESDAPRRKGSRLGSSRLDAETEFGISFDEALELFGGDGCGKARTAKQASRYIRKFVARKRREIKK